MFTTTTQKINAAYDGFFVVQESFDITTNPVTVVVQSDPKIIEFLLKY
jgi:hypothetical protein